MFQTLRSILGRAGGAQPGVIPFPGLVSVQVAADDVRASAVPVYPPIDGGIPMVPTHAVMRTQEALINRLRRHLALPQAEFEANYLEPIHRAAALVGLLPATKDKHFTGQGGLFRMCLELAVFSAQSADGVMFAGHAKIERRRQVENSWRHAAFFCGLAIELHRPLTEMVIVAPATGATWNPFMGPLTEWAQREGHDRVHVRWVDHAIQQAGAKSTAVWSLNYLIGQPIMASLHEVDGTIVQTMAGVVTDSITVVDDHTLAKVIRGVRRATIERDQALKPSLYGALTQGAHLEPWFLDAMRSLLMDGQWTVNDKGSRLNFGRDGCFITWPLAAKDVIRQMLDKKVQGVPAQEATLADMLLTAGIIARASDGSALWYVRTVEDPTKEVLAVKLSNPASILAVLDVQPIPSDEPLVATAARNAAPTVVNAAAPAPAAVIVPITQIVNMETGEITDPPPRGAAAPPALEPPALPPTGATAAPAAAPKQKRADKVAPPPPPAEVERSQPSPKDAPRSAKSRSGALPDVTPATQDIAGLDKQIVAALGPSLARCLASWVEDWNVTRNQHNFAWSNDGMALKFGLMLQSGMEPADVGKVFRDNGWLTMKELGGKLRTATKVQFQDEQHQAYVLTPAFAKRCGFVLP